LFCLLPNFRVFYGHLYESILNEDVDRRFVRMRLFLTGGSGFIGTNLIGRWEDGCESIVNYSDASPLVAQHDRYWWKGDIMDGAALEEALEAAQPTVVIHLAARTDCDEKVTVDEGYAVNTEGTRNLVKAVSECASVERLIVTSSQFVCRAGHVPADDLDFNPETVYGESKAESERITREVDADCVWTITRPTNVWGPYHMRYSREFWKVLDRGWYVHPGMPTPTRCYAYVGNLLWQMKRLLELPKGEVHERVFYLGDRPIDIVEWIEGFHRELAGREKMRVVPYGVIRAGALVGDAISSVTGKPFYITSSRLRSMSTDYLTPMERTFEILGEPPYTLDEGIRQTADWFRGWNPRPDGGMPMAGEA
jgi:nucleoside-diphosphate-sugar epimerase